MIVVEINNPSNCQYCPMSAWGFHTTLLGCNAKGHRYFTEKELSTDGKPDWCPIIGEFIGKIEEPNMDGSCNIKVSVNLLSEYGNKVIFGTEDDNADRD